MKRYIAVAIALVLLVSFAACQPAPPETVMVVETVVVEIEGETVVQTVVVEKEAETVVETIVVEKVVTLEDINLLSGVPGALDVQYAEVTVPMALGWFEDMGYQIDLMTAGGTLERVQQIVAGNMDIVQGNAGAFVQAIIQEEAPLVMFFQEGVVSWGLAVPADSDITEVEDFIGRNIGVYSMSSGGIPLLEGYMAENGISTNQYEMTVVGWGPQASEALRKGDVDAIMLWGGALANLENLGHDLRYFRSEMWNIMPDYGFATSKQYFEENRQTVVDFARGLTMGMIFVDANPDCARQVHWEAFPDSKPGDMSEEDAIAWDMTVMTSNFFYYKTAYESDGNGIWGYAQSDEFEVLMDYLLEQEMIEKKVDPSTYIPDEAFWDEVNDFDHQAIIDLAEACDY